jgi:hypothetical protein
VNLFFFNNGRSKYINFLVSGSIFANSTVLTKEETYKRSSSSFLVSSSGILESTVVFNYSKILGTC